MARVRGKPYVHEYRCLLCDGTGVVGHKMEFVAKGELRPCPACDCKGYEVVDTSWLRQARRKKTGKRRRWG